MRLSTYPHQYVLRNSDQVVTEKPIADRCIQFLYSSLRENAPAMFKAVTSSRMSSLLGYMHYDMVGRTKRNGKYLFEKIGADPWECVEPLSYYDSYRKVFERQIRYWETRPINRSSTTVVSPADSRVLIGSFKDDSALAIKDKFFDLDELLGWDCPWRIRFDDGDYAVFRLTPDKYHYNHVPVTGKVVTIYQLEGAYHSCNPTALMAMGSLYSKNRRVVTLIDTDIEGGTQVGLVAMVEVVALMIGEVRQVYSTYRYQNPQDLRPGMILRRGDPKSLFRPGSSTDVLIFEPGKIEFSSDIIVNSKRRDVKSRFTTGFGKPAVETDVLVRSPVAEPK